MVQKWKMEVWEWTCISFQTEDMNPDNNAASINPKRIWENMERGLAKDEKLLLWFLSFTGFKHDILINLE